MVFVCQNNQYGEFTPRMDSMNVQNIADRAASYGMPGVTVDGNDPDATYEVASVAIERARAGQGPTLIEATTYRFMGHVFGVDQMEYMPKEEMAAAIAADPVPAYRAASLETVRPAKTRLLPLNPKSIKRLLMQWSSHWHLRFQTRSMHSPTCTRKGRWRDYSG